MLGHVSLSRSRPIGRRQLLALFTRGAVVVAVAPIVACSSAGGAPPTPRPPETIVPSPIPPTPTVATVPATAVVPTPTTSVAPTATSAPLPTATAAPTATASATPSPVAEQLRAYWVDAFNPGIKSRAEIDRLLADVRDSGANAIIAQVRRRGDAYFNNRVEPRTEDPAISADFDALRYLIDRARAHERPIEIHAWVAALPIWRGAWAPPRDSNHVFNTHGAHTTGKTNWLTWSATGAQMDGTNYALDPGHPEAADYTVRIATELVRNYDVDGIHLDYIRYAHRDWGYNPTNVARFNARYDRSGHPAVSDARWADWRRDQVTALVRRIYLNAIAIRPTVQVSAALIAWGRGPTATGWENSAAYERTYQDWRAWMNEGIIDLGFLMNYFRESEPVGKLSYDEWTSFALTNQGQRHVAIGPGLFLNSASDSLAQVQRAIDRGSKGIALYSYDGFDREKTAPRAGLRSLLAGTGNAITAPFAQPARPPLLPWKNGSSDAHVSGQIIGADGKPSDGAEVTLTAGTGKRELRADGSGFFGAIGLPAGAYQVNARASGQAGVATVTILPGRVAEVEVRLNR